jgi:cytoskeleton protein RodZ
VTEPKTLGDYLRAARRRRRVGIERAAEQTRIRADYLMRMESDEFDFLAATYVRGFLRSYARFLNLDPEPLLSDFDRRHGAGRVDTAQILALERRSKRVPRERRKLNSWLVAAIVAGGALTLLAVVGLAQQQPERQPERREVAGATESPEPEPTPTETPTPTPTPTPTRTTKPKLALNQGIRVEIVAARADCWIDVTADGLKVYQRTLAVGERAGPFSAEESMSLVLGNAYGVDLILNGRRIGPLGESGQVLPITLPDDAKELL